MVVTQSVSDVSNHRSLVEELVSKLLEVAGVVVSFRLQFFDDSPQLVEVMFVLNHHFCRLKLL